jgi:hypothetical protein
LISTSIYSIYNKNILVAKAFNVIKCAVIVKLAAIKYQYAVKNGNYWQEYLLLTVSAELIICFKLQQVYVAIIAAIISRIIL